MPRWPRIAIGAVGAALAVPAGYLLCALVFGLVPVNAGFRSAVDGVPVFVRTNGIHAELVLRNGRGGRGLEPRPSRDRHEGAGVAAGMDRVRLG